MKEIMFYFTMIVLTTNNLYQWIIMARMARRIKGIEGKVERDEYHHWQLVYEVNKLKKENENGL